MYLTFVCVVCMYVVCVLACVWCIHVFMHLQRDRRLMLRVIFDPSFALFINKGFLNETPSLLI